ncbi:phosphotransferase [Rathayibacter sp. CAU 1779]
MVSFIHGDAALSSAAQQRIGETEPLAAVARMTRELHDLTVGTPLAAGAEVACHNDLDPRNTIYRSASGTAVPVAFIDWDLAAPGARVHDLAHVCWTFTGIRRGADANLVKSQIRTVTEAYRWDGRLREVIDSMLWWQNRCWEGIVAEARAGNAQSQAMVDDGIVTAIQRDYEWTRRELSSL